MKEPKPRTFRVHFNRIAMQRKQPDVWSIQMSDRCLHASEIDIRVPLKTVYRPDKKENPRAFFMGRGIVQQDGLTIRIT